MEEPDSIISDHSLSRRICAASLHDGLLFHTDDKIRVENVCADDEPSDAEQDQISQGILKVNIDFFVEAMKTRVSIVTLGPVKNGVILIHCRPNG